MLDDLNDESVITSGGGEISMLEPGTSGNPVVSSTCNLEAELDILSGRGRFHTA